MAPVIPATSIIQILKILPIFIKHRKKQNSVSKLGFHRRIYSLSGVIFQFDLELSGEIGLYGIRFFVNFIVLMLQLTKTYWYRTPM